MRSPVKAEADDIFSEEVTNLACRMMTDNIFQKAVELFLQLTVLGDRLPIEK